MPELDEMTKGACQEAGNIGMGHLATALSKMVGREVKIDIPLVDMYSIDQIIEQASEGSQKSVVGIAIHITGDISGRSLLLLPKFSALSFSDLLLKKSIGSTIKIEGRETMKLKEMGVLLCSAYMRAVNDFLAVDLQVSNPEIVVNMDGVGDFIKEQLGELADEYIVIKSTAIVPSTNSKNEFNLLFGPDASDIIMAAVMKKMMG